MDILNTPLFKNHVEVLKSSTLNRFTGATIPEWICKHTKIQGKAYSFKDHEYQERIARDESQEKVIQKCSQVGISELSARLSLALCAVHQHFTVAYTLPTAGFAALFMRTRVDPVIQSSDYLSSIIHTSTDNSEVKRLGESYLYLKGAQSNNAPISIPVDTLVHDELDFSSPEVISQYQSRLTHSPFKNKIKLSTPTDPNVGISKEFKSSRRHFMFVKCNHCNNLFIPDFHEHIRIPGSPNVNLRDITKTNLPKYRWQEAHIACPSCGKTPSLQPEYRQWVCENPDENHIAVGYQVSPFDAPNIITVPYLIQASTQYKKYSDFENFGLGKPAEDRESTITRSDLEPLLLDGSGSLGYGSYVMGLDMGLWCHCVIGFHTLEGTLIIVHTEAIHVSKVRVRRKELAREWHVRMTVVDTSPYIETVLAMQQEDMNLYGAFYTKTKGLEIYHVKEQEEDKEKARMEVRQVNINRNKMLDSIMDELRSKKILKVKDKNDEDWMTQLCDMKRGREFSEDQELIYVWKKSEDGNDHYHHATLYCRVASNLLGVATGSFALPFMAKAVNLTKQLDEVDLFFGRRNPQ